MRKRKTPATSPPRRFSYKKVCALALALLVFAGGWLLARPGWLRGAGKHRLTNAGPRAATSDLPANSPSKEYVYAGPRLIAIEEAGVGASGLSAPSGLVASGTSSQIVVVWKPTPGAHHYRLERAESVSASGPDFRLLPGVVGTNSFTDSVEPNKSFLYRARAAEADGRLSQPGNVDLATSVSFTDDPLPGRVATGNGATITAAHLNELRRAVGAVRALAGLAGATYSHPDPPGAPSPRRTIFLADVLELRAALDAALAALGMQRPYVTDPSLSGGHVKAAHFRELRDRVR